MVGALKNRKSINITMETEKISSISSMDLSKSMQSSNGKLMPAYIGAKIVKATPMDEIYFLKTHKWQDVSDRETQPGYMVVYEDGYKSWSPKDVFERSYRLITDSEAVLIK